MILVLLSAKVQISSQKLNWFYKLDSRLRGNDETKDRFHLAFASSLGWNDGNPTCIFLIFSTITL